MFAAWSFWIVWSFSFSKVNILSLSYPISVELKFASASAFLRSELRLKVCDFSSYYDWSYFCEVMNISVSAAVRILSICSALSSSISFKALSRDSCSKINGRSSGSFARIFSTFMNSGLRYALILSSRRITFSYSGVRILPPTFYYWS